MNPAERLVKILRDHQRDMDDNCGCGWKWVEYVDTQDHPGHVAEVILGVGLVPGAASPAA